MSAKASSDELRPAVNRAVGDMHFAKIVALAVAGIAALTAPVLIGVTNAQAIRAQPAAAAKFEVASIKPCKDGDDGGGRGGSGGSAGGSSPGRLSLSCRPVMAFIRAAYVQFAGGTRRPAGRIPIEGGPAWINSEPYQIDAKAEGPASLDMMRGPMMLALLEDRFKLRIHRQTREVPVYLLTVGKDGPKLQPTKEGGCTPTDFTKGPPPPPGPGQPPPCGPFLIAGNGGMDTYGQTMAGLCTQFSGSLDRDVVDKTGIGGAFDIHLDLSYADLFAGAGSDSTPGVSDPAAPLTPADPVGAVMRAVQKLGLKLESAKGTGEFLVIDHVERPSEN